jgi:hypothetical protein
MRCPLKNVDLDTEICPIRCIYRRSDGACAHNELAYDENLTSEDIADILGVSAEEVEAQSAIGKKKIKIAMVVEAYLGFANRGDSEEEVKINEHLIFRLFNLPRSRLKSVLSRDRFEKWKELSKVDVSFEEVKALFLDILNTQGV